ncbi:hypothetical protein MKX01_010108 [Papaver californicum]|nr:hypothetical protein MKX01_010108 [Papaver californicum]
MALVPSSPPLATKTIDPCLSLLTMLSPSMLDLEECFFYMHTDFLRGQKHLLETIRKEKHVEVQRQQQQPQGQSSSVGGGGVESDKHVLIQEIVKLRQQKQSTDHQLGQRLQGMEQQQQQMISFLAKAMQSPGFLAQLVQQQNENNRRIAGAKEKRTLPNLEDGHSTTVFDGHIIKYQPLLNETAQAMLMQLNLASPSHKLDVGSISIDDIPSPSSIQLYNGISSGYSGIHPSAVISEIQSSGVVTDAFTTTTSPLPDTSILDALEEELGLPHMQYMGLENKGIEIPGANFVGHGH